jgi:hypothetical protein
LSIISKSVLLHILRQRPRKAQRWLQLRMGKVMYIYKRESFLGRRGGMYWFSHQQLHARKNLCVWCSPFLYRFVKNHSKICLCTVSSDDAFDL